MDANVVRELIAKWREQAKQRHARCLETTGEEKFFHAGRCEQLHTCADLLELALHDWIARDHNAITAEVKAAGTDENGICRIIAITTPLELGNCPPIIYKRVRISLAP